MRSKRLVRLAWGVATLAIAGALGGAVLIALNGWEQVTGYSMSGVGLGIAFPAIGSILAARRPENPIGWIFCAIGLSQGVDVFVTQYAEYGLTSSGSLFGADVASWLALWTFVPGFGLLLTFTILLFPSGRLPSRRWLPIAYLSAAGIALMVIPVAIVAWGYRGLPLAQEDDLSQISEGLEAAQQLQGVGFLIMLVCALGCVAGLIWRFRRSTGEERAQLKWFTYAGAVVVTLVAITPFVRLPQVLDAAMALVLAPMLPAATAIAILRYRLFDIDRLISRTLVYATLTAVLIAGYAGGVLLLQALLPLPNDSAAAVAVSTLAMAALFRPLRTRVQSLVDRRFYRARYDATRTIDEFSARLRQQTDLDSLTDDLLGVVQQAVRPAYASVWLRDVQVLGP